MDSMIMRRMAAFIGVGLGAATLIVSAPQPVAACSCAPPPAIEDAIAEEAWVFVGRQVESHSGFSGVRLEIEVIEVYKGDVPDTVFLRTGRGGGDCGVDLGGWDEVGLTVTPDQEGVARVGLCGGSVDAAALRLAFEPLPAGSGTGPPGFLVGTDLGPARVAVLDTAGELLTYGEGAGRLAAAAVCPGARKIVEIVEPETRRDDGALDLPTLEVRDMESLAVERISTIQFELRERSSLNGMGWVFDLQCHDADAQLVTYLLPSGRWDARAGANLPGPARLHVWEGETYESVDAGDARTVAVDPFREVFYAITGIKGTTLETRKLSGRLVEDRQLPDDAVGWRLALSPDRSELVVLSRDRPMDRDNWFFAEVNQILVMDLIADESASYALPGAGFAVLLETHGDAYMAAVSQWESNTMEITRLAEADVQLLQTIPASGLRDWLAIGPKAIVAPPNLNDGAAAIPVRVDLASGARSEIEGLVRSRLGIALPNGTVIDSTPPDSSTTTSAPPPTSAPPTTDSPPASDSGGDDAQARVETPVAEDRNGTSAWPTTVVVVATLLAIVAGVTVVARKRTENRTPGG